MPLKSNNRKNDYVDNKRLYTEMVKWKTKCQDAIDEGLETPRIPNYVAESFMKIAENLSRLPKFSGYSYREDMIAEAVMTCVRYADRFDPDKSNNPFAYFSMICNNSFWLVRKKEKQQGDIRKAVILDSGILSDVSEAHEHDDSIYTSGFIEQIENYVGVDDMERIHIDRQTPSSPKRRKARTKVSDSNLDDIIM